MASSNKVALITGASSGIGRATALEFAKLGYMVAITGRNQARLDETLDEMAEVAIMGANEAAPQTIHIDRQQQYLALRVNFELESEVDSIIERVINKFNKLDILINNAGYVGESHDLLDEEFYEDFQRILQVNLMSSVRLAQLAAPHLIKHSAESPGILINVSSIADRVPIRAIAYCVSKAGLSMLTKTLANSLEGKPVRVLTVSPGPIRTQLAADERLLDYMGTRATLLHRPGLAREVAALIVFLASERASYMHATTVDIDGGQVTKLGTLITEGLGQVLANQPQQPKQRSE